MQITFQPRNPSCKLCTLRTCLFRDHFYVHSPAHSPHFRRLCFGRFVKPFHTCVQTLRFFDQPEHPLKLQSELFTLCRQNIPFLSHRASLSLKLLRSRCCLGSFPFHRIQCPPQLAVLSNHAKNIRTMIFHERRKMNNSLRIRWLLTLEHLYLHLIHLKRITQSCQSFLEFANLRSQNVTLPNLYSQVVTSFPKILNKLCLGLPMRL